MPDAEPVGSDQEPVVADIDSEPVAAPQAVHRVDPVQPHRDR